jgi:hypothetical protein
MNYKVAEISDVYILGFLVKMGNFCGGKSADGVLLDKF